MRFPYFLSYCLRTPWAMEPEAMRTYAMMLANLYARRSGLAAADAPAAAAPEAAAPRGPQQVGGGIALVRVFGPIVQRAAELGPCENGTGAVEIGNAISAALADESIGSILMQFSTPGGSVFGIRELGDQIREARGRKPVIGIADSMAASAGYWLLSQCSEAYVTPGGMVGSIGVYSAHQDVSQALENEGIKVTLISAGKYKVEGHPFAPLSEEAAAHQQSQMNAYYTMFTQAIARGRGVPVDQVRTGMGEGRVLLADDALAAKMVDGVMTFSEVVRKMQRDMKGPRGGRSALATARAQLAITD